MSTNVKRLPWRQLLMGCATSALVAGCATVAEIGQMSGVITAEQAQSLVRTGDAFGKALEEITPQQEYYVGRSVGASIVTRYKAFNREAATQYINVLGQTLAMASNKPETYGGYHFLILDSGEINAFAAPGGLIFVSRGMLRLCTTEDELAAVLAHEVGHVNLGHAIAAISNSRWTTAATILGTESAKSFGGGQLSELTTAFQGSIEDITGTLITSGYARGQEKDADRLAVEILQRVGYDPEALVRMLRHMEKGLKPGGMDFAKTHPPPAKRIADIEKLLNGQSAPAAPAARAARFQRAMQGV